MKKKNQTQLSLGKETIMSLSTKQASYLYGGGGQKQPNDAPLPAKDGGVPPTKSGVDCSGR